MAKSETHKGPAVVRVQSTEEAEAIVALAAERRWKVIVGVEPDQVEDVSDLRKLMRFEAPNPGFRRGPMGNNYCPCRSGKKFGNCCCVATVSPGA